MKKCFCLFLLTAFVSSYNANAQDTTWTKRDLYVQRLLGINDSAYGIYSRGIKEYDMGVKALMDDKKLTGNQREAAIKKLLLARKKYQKQHLSEGQISKLEQDNRINMPPSQRKKRHKEMQERLAKRKIKVLKDSTNKKP